MWNELILKKYFLFEKKEINKINRLQIIQRHFLSTDYRNNWMLHTNVIVFKSSIIARTLFHGYRQSFLMTKGVVNVDDSFCYSTYYKASDFNSFVHWRWSIDRSRSLSIAKKDPKVILLSVTLSVLENHVYFPN